ncbi:enoyl-CoA hydratase/isomerase family protein [Mycolicibacterium sphagni]|uniref:Crotonase n=1 Tax=Mycolicibacterium sphagni TaxID=1786 RepID=A0A255DCM2_9MYCO|nr:enoyl-CoA hydratase/isomerase family protein [Mycolicibacterium sphagni]MCV7177566.1 enoyl-CoA hydratase/isomerase family protein [Mycolicibacterium sphagni]OYN74682.1 crotonase [Mycolicibacterium sphagni]
MTIETSDRGHVRTIALNRPERLNAFNGQLVTDLGAALQQAAADAEISVVVLTGTGRAFSAGADLKEIAEHLGDSAATEERRPTDTGAFAELIDALAEFPKPLIMAVNGVGVGFGMTILGFADVAFMSSEARLRCPFTSIGAPPEAASTYLLPLLLGRQNAAWALMSSEWISAEEAREIGLVWKVCTPDGLLTEAHRHADLLADKPAHILTTMKRLLNAPHREQIAAAAARENQAMAEMLGTGANADAVASFLQR